MFSLPYAQLMLAVVCKCFLRTMMTCHHVQLSPIISVQHLEGSNSHLSILPSLHDIITELTDQLHHANSHMPECNDEGELQGGESAIGRQLELIAKCSVKQVDFHKVRQMQAQEGENYGESGDNLFIDFCSQQHSQRIYHL